MLDLDELDELFALDELLAGLLLELFAFELEEDELLDLAELEDELLELGDTLLLPESLP